MCTVYECWFLFYSYTLQRPTIDSCTTLPITGYYIHAIVTNTNGDVNERVYTSNYIDDMLGGIMGEFSVSYNDRFDQNLLPNANYIFVVNTQNNVSEISRTNTRPSCSKYCLCVYTYFYRDLRYISIQQYIDTVIEYRIVILCSISIEVSKWL